MLTEPYLFFADVSLDLSKGEYQSGLQKLQPILDRYPDSYLVNLLFGKALKGVHNYRAARSHFERCCHLAPANQIAKKELIELQTLYAEKCDAALLMESDPVSEELEKITAALHEFQPQSSSESYDPTPIIQQKQPFPDDAIIEVPTETLAKLFVQQGAYKKAIKIYTSLIQLKPELADTYTEQIDSLLEKL
jgi:tetratricopeptide (TPR) repeat protein